MGNVKHQKKRNSGLLYQFLTRKISEALVEGDNKKSSHVLKILKKHFKPGSELYSEFRIINALMKTSVDSEAVAYSIVNEAKQAVQKQDTLKLDRQKSILIKHINHSLNDPLFYDQPISEYKTYATIQTLVNEWRKTNDRDIRLIAEHENALIKWLISEKKVDNDSVLSDHSTGTNRLLIKVMMEKVNEKYGDTLTGKQKEIIREYVWSTANDNVERIKNKLDESRSELMESMDKYIFENGENKYLLDQLNEVKTKLVNEDLNNVNDEVVARFLNYMKLNDEFGTKE